MKKRSHHLRSRFTRNDDVLDYLSSIRAIVSNLFDVGFIKLIVGSRIAYYLEFHDRCIDLAYWLDILLLNQFLYLANEDGICWLLAELCSYGVVFISFEYFG